MNIYGKIVTAMVAFEHLTGQKSTVIFAGEDEVAELEGWGKSVGSTPFLAGPADFRDRAAGLGIVEVKDKSFLSVGIKV